MVDMLVRMFARGVLGLRRPGRRCVVGGNSLIFMRVVKGLGFRRSLLRVFEFGKEGKKERDEGKGKWMFMRSK